MSENKKEMHLPPGASEKSTGEIRLSSVIRKLLEISDGSGDDVDLGGNVCFDNESLMIQADNEGVEYKFWFKTNDESNQFFVSEVEVDAAVTGVSLTWSGTEDDILSILEDCLSGEEVWEDLKPVAFTFAK